MRPLIIGIGGAHSGAGKTTCASQLLRHFKGWGAIKYTKTSLYSSITDDGAVLSEEEKDTRKFLDSGAHKVLWVKAPVSELRETLPIAVDRLHGLPGIIVEGNSAIEFLEPDIIIFIFGTDPKKIKESARGLLTKADIILSDDCGRAGEAGKVKRFPKSAVATEEFLLCVTEMVENKEKIRRSLQEKSEDGKIPCPVARRIAEELKVPYEDVGATANELKIKIQDCELGCF